MPPLIALALTSQIVDNVPTEPHDQFLDAVVTENAIYGAEMLLSPSGAEPSSEPTSS